MEGKDGAMAGRDGAEPGKSTSGLDFTMATAPTSCSADSSRATITATFKQGGVAVVPTAGSVVVAVEYKQLNA